MFVAVPFALAASQPHFSYPKMVTANGYGAVVFADDRLADAFPHLYQQLDADHTTPEVLYDSYFGVTDDSGTGGWLTDVDDAAYVPGTGVLRIERSRGDLAVVEYDFAPMDLGGFGLAQVAQVVNTGTVATSAVQLVSIHNWHLGGTETVTSASATTFSEAGTDLSLVYDAPDATDVSCAGVYDAVLAGQRIGGGCNGSGDDMVPAFGWSIPALQPGEEVWVGVVTGADDPGSWIAGRTPDLWLADEESGWETLHGQGTEPAGMSDDEAAVYRQSVAFLRMGQVKEEGDAYGQIPASMPVSAPVGDFRHIWNITWVRDGSYAAAALAASGYPDDAADLLAFLIQEGKTGDYRAYVGDADYAVSVCRTYGDGTEWSDVDADGPNVEFDDFGLFLWALGRVRDAGGDVEDLLPRARDGVADALVRLVDPNTDLLLPDSSIWERHWNGNQQQFTYSSVWAVAGLRAAAAFTDDGDTYQDASDRIAAAIPVELVDAEGVVAASREQLESGSSYLDLAAVEAFDQGILDPKGPGFTASMLAWDRDLRVASGNGYRRNDDGSEYDEHEWVFIDLRLADALRRACRTDEAAALEAWVTLQARANHDTLPELMDPTGGDFAGPAPMLGFGAGAYVLAMNGREEADAACAAGTPLDDPPGTDPGGCGGCGGGAKSALLLPLFALTRRRRP